MDKKKKILLVSIVFFVCVAFTSHVSGAINELYTTSTADATWLSDVAEKNSLLAPISYLILWLAGAIEFLLSSLANMLGTQTSVMPWADAILFNAVPLLDPNFINPADGSIAKILGGVLGKIYFTIFCLSVSFFSISVLLMAIKLAISSIASEKAKYKEAITNWIIGLVLLFSMHFLMSFCFYLNESLVKVASDIAMEQTKKLNLTVDASKASDTIISDVDDLILSLPSNNQKLKDFFAEEESRQILEAIVTEPCIQTIYRAEGASWYVGEGSEGPLYCIGAIIAAIREEDGGLLKDVVDRKGYQTLTVAPLTEGDYIYGITDYSCNRLLTTLIDDAKKYDIALSTQDYFSVFIANHQFFSDDWDYTSLEVQVTNLIMRMEDSDTNYNDLGSTPITQLANYFKLTCYDYDDESGNLKKDRINPVHVLLYVIFVVQSLLYFFAYVKRLFYIIVLAMMAPIIVTYNFVMQI